MKNNILIREYNDKDFKDVSRIIKEAFNYEKKDIKDDNSKEFVCTIDDKVVGYFYIHLKRDIIKNILIGDIEYVCVDEDYREQGIGGKMMDFAEMYSKDNGIARLELTSGNQRIAAHKLYLSHGFLKRDTSVFRKDINIL